MDLAESEHSTHCMIALHPDAGLAGRLAIDGGEPAGDLHCTVVYTGRTADVDEQALRATVENLLGREPVDATINGVARFSGATVDDPDAVVLLVDSPALEVLRRDALAALADYGIEPPLNHGFTAHMTISYVDPDADMPLVRVDPIETTFTTLAMEYGDERVEYSFAGAASTAEAARQSYVSGWAASGGPLTDRVRAGCIAAAELAETDPHRVGVAEATLRLGHMEGTWAAIFDRRDRLHDRTWAAVLAAWLAFVKDVDADQVVADVQSAAAGRDNSGDTRAALVPLVAGYVLGALRAASTSGSTDTPTAWDDLRAATQAGIASAHAEGAANAAALAADRAGGIGFDHDTAHTDALSAVADRDDTWSAADVALHTALAATATMAARRLVAMAPDDDTDAESLGRELGDVLDAGAALRVEVINVIDTAFAASMWRLYQLSGVTSVNLITAGGGKVCPICVAAEERNPYGLFDSPVLPEHPRCRCVLDVAEGALPASLYTTYLPAT